MNLRAKLGSAWLLGLACLLVCCETVRAYDWLPATNKVVVMAVWAHPDDEGIFGGGSLPYYSTVLNVPTMLVCMTHGATNDVRTSELSCAAWTYGLRYAPVFGQFRDVESNIAANNPYTNTSINPSFTNSIDMTWDYWADNVLQGDGSDVAAGKAKAINFVAEQIRRYRPDVIITHDLNGETGHDNHKATAYAVTQAFYVAGDTNATATNLVGLAAWQAQKLYVHTYPTNRLFHEFWETQYPALTNLTSHQVVNTGLTCHVSQGPARWISSSVYPPASSYPQWPSEYWGLYASTVGPDTVLSSNLLLNGYTVPAGGAVGDFLQHTSLDPSTNPPAFMANPLVLPAAATYDTYTNQTLANYIFATDPIWALVFNKISGPAWLNVARDGALSGSSSHADVGTNSWLVSVTNRFGHIAQTTLVIPLLSRAVGLENLVAWWKLDETSPNSPVASNAAPLSPDGVSYGGTTFGQAGARPSTWASVQFNGTDGKIDAPFAAVLKPPLFTVALWANATGGSGNYRSPLTSRTASHRGYIFYAGPNNVWQFWTGDGTNWTALSGGPVVTNAWIHLAATYDGTTLSFYTNGVLAGATNVAVQLNDNLPLRIGAGATEGAGNYWFPGRVDDVRVYRVALDAAHVKALSANPPFISSIEQQSDGTMLVSGSTVSNQTCILLSSSNQSPGTWWSPVATNIADVNGNLLFTDVAAVNFVQRFYRLITP